MKGWMRVAFCVAYGVFIGLLAGGILLLVSSPPRGAAIALLPPPTPGPVIVHVAGAVAQPGVYSLPAGSRVQDAIQAAGGLLVEADQRALNLAALVEDGSRVLIATLPPPTPTAAPGSPVTPPAAGSEQQPVVYPININLATQAELENLPGIGPAIARRIIEYRDKNGPFKSIEELMNVSGIGPKTFEDLKSLITV